MGILLVGKVEKTEVDINLDKARKTDALAQQGATFVADGELDCTSPKSTGTDELGCGE